MDTTIAMVIVFAMFFGTIALRIVLSPRSEMERLRIGYYNDDITPNDTSVDPE